MKGIQTLILFLALQVLNAHAETLPLDRSLFRIANQTNQASPTSWVSADILSAFFSRVPGEKGRTSVVLPAVTVGFRFSRFGMPAFGATYAVLLDRQGRKVKVPLAQQVVETVWPITQLPQELPLDLLNEKGDVVATVKFMISAKDGVVVTNKLCQDTGLTLVDSQLQIPGTLFLICENQAPALTVLYGSADFVKPVEWTPRDGDDLHPYPQVVQVQGTNPYLGLEVQTNQGPSHIDLMYRHSFESLDWVRPLEIALGAGYVSSFISPVPPTARGLRAFSDVSYRFKGSRWSINLSLFAQVNQQPDTADLPPHFYWGGRLYANPRIGTKKGRWSYFLPMGVRYYNLGGYRHEELQHLLGPLVGLGTSYERPQQKDRFYLTSLVSFETVSAPFYWSHFNWYTELKWQHYFSSGRSWGIKGHFDYLGTGTIDEKPLILNTLMAGLFFTL